MRVRFIVITLLVLAVCVFAIQKVKTTGRQDASNILMESARRSHNLSYTGLVENSALYYCRKIDTLMRIYHNGSGERMEYLNSPVKGMVVIETAGHTYTFHPQANKPLVSRVPAPRTEQDRVKLLLANYYAKTAGEEVVAKRPAFIVDVTPKHKGNPSKRIWIDKKTYLVLKQEDRSSCGSIKSRMAFREISFSRAIPDAKLALPAKDKIVSNASMMHEPMGADALSRHVGFRVTRPEYVPEGYKFAGYQLYRCRCRCGHNSAYLSYTDGLNSISVFETPINAGCQAASCKLDKGCGEKDDTECRIGDCRQAQVGQMRVGDKNVFIIADLPQTQIERIAKSIK